MKYASAFLVTAECALYFGFALLLPRFVPLLPAVLLFLGIVFAGMVFSEMLRKIPVLRAVPLLLPAAALFLCPEVSMQSVLLFVPPFLYALVTAASGRFRREYWRCSRIAKVLMIAAIPAVLVLLITDPERFIRFTPLVIFYVFCIIGLRMSRIGAGAPAGWFLLNAAELLPIPAAGLLTAGVIFLVYNLRKVFEILLFPFAFLFSLIPTVFSWFFGLFKAPEKTAEETQAAVESAAAEASAAFSETQSPGGIPFDPEIRINWRIVLPVVMIVLITAGALILILVLRKNRPEEVSEDGGISGGKFTRSARKKRKAGHAGTPADRIRACYREYLSLQSQKGLQRVPGDTSLDVLRFSEGSAREAEESRLRALYVKARYRGIADPEEAKEAEQILKLLKE